MVWAAPATCFYVVNVFSLNYLTNTVGLPSQTAFLSLMTGNVFAVLTMRLSAAQPAIASAESHRWQCR